MAQQIIAWVILWAFGTTFLAAFFDDFSSFKEAFAVALVAEVALACFAFIIFAVSWAFMTVLN